MNIINTNKILQNICKLRSNIIFTRFLAEIKIIKLIKHETNSKNKQAVKVMQAKSTDHCIGAAVCRVHKFFTFEHRRTDASALLLATRFRFESKIRSPASVRCPSERVFQRSSILRFPSVHFFEFLFAPIGWLERPSVRGVPSRLHNDPE